MIPKDNVRPDLPEDEVWVFVNYVPFKPHHHVNRFVSIYSAVQNSDGVTRKLFLKIN